MKKKIIITTIILAILAIVTFFIVKKVKQTNATSSTGTGTGFPLKQGSKGEEVKIVQNSLNKIIGNTIAADGVFGQQTENALYIKVGLKQLTKKQYEAFISVFSGLTLVASLYDHEKNQIKNA